MRLVKKWWVLTVVIFSIMGMNIYRLFPVAQGESLLGDKVYYVFQSLSWIMIVQALRWRENDRKDEIILAGFLSFALNQLLFEFIGDPTKINWQHFLIGTIVTVEVCWKLHLKWYWLASIILVVYVFLLI